MKTRYKHIHFEEEPGCVGPTKTYCKTYWECRNNKTNERSADVYFYDLWKKYVIEFMPEAIFDSNCLDDIAQFLRELNNE